MTALSIASRWIHVVMACLVVGGVFFIRFVFPAGQTLLPDDLRQQVLLKTRRRFKMVIHTAILFLILTGIYNSMMVFKIYNRNPPLMHSLWGTHILLALIAFCIALFVLAGPNPPASHRKLMAINFIILLITIAVASTLKFEREKLLLSNNAAAPMAGNP